MTALLRSGLAGMKPRRMGPAHAVEIEKVSRPLIGFAQATKSPRAHAKITPLEASRGSLSCFVFGKG